MMGTPPGLSDTQPRACPACGASVSSRAKTCLICGADLTPSVTPIRLEIHAQPAPRRLPWRLVMIALGMLVLLLTAGGLWLRLSAAVAPTPAPTSTSLPTATPTDTPTPLPTETPTPTPNVTPTSSSTPIPPTSYTVRYGDTLDSIARRFNTTIEVIQSFNDLEQSDVIQIGQVLLIPAADATPGPTRTPPPTATFVPGPTPGTVLHVVQTGDTLLGLSLKYGVPMSVIQKANDIRDPESIKIGQQLVIPIGPTGTPTAGPQPTPTGPPRYPAPPLLSPIDGQVFEGNAEPILLRWASVGILLQNEYYFVRLEHVGSGRQPETFYTKATGWHIPTSLFPKPNDPNRLFQWQVGVVRITGSRADGMPIYTEAGPVSPTRSFQWVTAQPTATPTPKSAP